MILICLSFCLLLNAAPCLSQTEFRNHIMLELGNESLSTGDEVILDGKFRNRLAQLRFIGINETCRNPSLSRHILPQCHPLIIRFKPRFHKIEVKYRGKDGLDKALHSITNLDVSIGSSYRLSIKVGPKNYTIFLNGQLVRVVNDKIGHDDIEYIRSYGGYFREYYVVRAQSKTTEAKTRKSGDTGVCGMRPGLVSADLRITGGQNAKAAEFPWQAALRRKFTRPWAQYKHLCGASLIRPCWVLTAAHCVEDLARFPNNYVVRVGDYYNGEEGYFLNREAEQDFEIERVIAHANFQARPSPRDDIALIKLRSNSPSCVTISDFVRPICLPEKNETKRVGSICTVTGWGARKWSDRPNQFPNVLQKAEVKVKDYSTCVSSYGANEGGHQRVANNTVCAADKGKDACQGDSGGPLACKRIMTGSGTNFVLWGITSWGEECATATKPGVFTKVVDYIDWIEQNIAEVGA